MSTTRNTYFAYDPQGNLLTKTLVDGSTENRTYDNRNRVTAQLIKEPDGTTTRLSQTYDYDLAGNLTLLTESTGAGTLPTRVLICEYDGTHRLVTESDTHGSDPAVVTQYTYDKADNRTLRVVTHGPTPGTTSYAIGDGTTAGANQIISLTRPDSSVVSYTYDDNGARLTRSDSAAGGRTDTSTYDVWERLISLDFQTPASPVSRGTYGYSYDGRTRRVSLNELGTSTVLSFMGGVSAQEYAATPGTGPGGLPAATVENVRGPNMGGGVGGMLYGVRSGVASLAHSDSRGDIIAKVNETTSALTWQAQYEAYGKRNEETGTNPDRQRANSKDEDPTGLLNEGFRYRDLETGTFITRDPAGFVDGPNLYTYVRQNPWTHFDPEGLSLFGMWDHLFHGEFGAAAMDAPLMPGLSVNSILSVPSIPGAIAASYHRTRAVAAEDGALKATMYGISEVSGANKVAESFARARLTVDGKGTLSTQGMSLRESIVSGFEGAESLVSLSVGLGAIGRSLTSIIKSARATEFEVSDGVKRAKAAQLRGDSTIEGVMNVEKHGKIETKTVDVPIDKLKSPHKSKIDLGDPKVKLQWERIQKAWVIPKKAASNNGKSWQEGHTNQGRKNY